MPAEISFPHLSRCQGREGCQCAGTLNRLVELEPARVRGALFSRKAQKSFGPDRLGAPVLQPIWGWARKRVADVVVHCYRLYAHQWSAISLMECLSRSRTRQVTTQLRVTG